MRFKARLFPMIDVMILMLGLFLVILARAQLTEEPLNSAHREALDEEPEEEKDPGKLRGVTVIFKFRTRSWHIEANDILLSSEAVWLAGLAELGHAPENVVVIARVNEAFHNRAIVARLDKVIRTNCHSLAYELTR